MERGLDIEKLKGSENYHTWSFAIRNVLILKGYDSYIDSETVADADKPKKSACKAILCLSVDKHIFVHIQTCATPKQIWKALQDLFEDKGLSRKIGLLRNLISTRLDTSANMQSYIDDIKTNSARLTGIGFALSDEWLAAIILAGLTDDYRPFIMGFEASGKDLKSDAIISKLLDGQTSANSNANALLSKATRNKAHEKKKPKIKCMYCKKNGHTENVCRKKQKDEKEKENVSAKAAFIAHTHAQEAYATPHKVIGKNEWYIDSGASSHMTPHGQMLSNIQPTNVTEIISANSAKLQVKGAGEMTLITNDQEIVVNDVLHVPGLSANLLSVHHIASKGNSVLFDSKGCTIRNADNEIVAMCESSNGVYKLQSNDSVCLKTNHTVSSFTWHRRLGHINLQSMKKMRDGAVDGLNFNEECAEIQNCETCAYGKQTRLPFARSERHSENVLDLIHSDLMGPMETISIGKSRYILSFVDDYSRKVFLYFLKEKSEVFYMFKAFKSLVENQTERKIKILRTDNGTEYLSNAFTDFCKMNGIQHQLTTAYTPQQNGVAERMNRTIIERAKCLLFDANLPKRFWAEASGMAVYLINRCVSAATGGVPEELFSNKRVDLSDLKLFGSTVMVHIPEQKRKKWDSKSKKMVFVGYDCDKKGYRCIEPKTGALTISRDVKFIEEPAKSSIEIDLENDHVRDVEDETNDSSIITVNSSDEAEETLDESVYDDTVDRSTHNDDPDYEPDESLATPQPEPPRRNPTRTARGNATEGTSRPLQLTNFAFFVEPETVAAAMNGPDAEKWISAMDEEMSSHSQNDTWSLTKLPKGRTAITAKWVFKTKSDDNGNIVRYKARLVARGCSQKPGIDYLETFSPVVRYNSIRFLIALAVQNGLKIHQMDAITAFLQGDLNEEIFMRQPEHYDDGTGRVCRLNRSIYGLKQAGRQWNLKLDDALQKFGLKKSKLDPCIYFSGDLSVLIAIYVDDFLLFFKNMEKLEETKQYLCRTFKMKDLGAVSNCIGMRIKQFNDSIEIDQAVYVEQILNRFGMADCKPVKTPSEVGVKLSIQTITPSDSLVGKVPYQEAVGSLLYLTQSTRPDIAFAVNNVSRFNQDHGHAQWTAVKRIFRYLRGTTNAKLCYTKSDDGVMAYTDADWASEIDGRRSCSGYVVKFSNASICWSSKRQPIVALSSTEAEYIALSSATCELIWLQQLANELNTNVAKQIKILCDNQSTMKLAASDAYRPRTKHIDIRYHHIRELINTGVIKIDFVPTAENAADSLTKAVSAEKTKFCNDKMGLTFGND